MDDAIGNLKSDNKIGKQALKNIDEKTNFLNKHKIELERINLTNDPNNSKEPLDSKIKKITKNLNKNIEESSDLFPFLTFTLNSVIRSNHNFFIELTDVKFGYVIDSLSKARMHLPKLDFDKNLSQALDSFSKKLADVKMRTN